MCKRNKKPKPNHKTVHVTVVEIVNRNGKRVATLQPARLCIKGMFAGCNFDPATVIKNLRHLQSFDPRSKVEVCYRGRPPQMVQLNRIRIDPDNTLVDRPGLAIVPYGTIYQDIYRRTRPNAISA